VSPSFTDGSIILKCALKEIRFEGVILIYSTGHWQAHVNMSVRGLCIMQLDRYIKVGKSLH
jgi:hypothetical protein